MKELHFTKSGRMHVAEEGNKRFVIHDLGTGAWMAKVFYRFARRPRPIADKACASRAEAVNWCAGWRTGREDRDMREPAR